MVLMARRMHYAKIEGNMSEMVERIKTMEGSMQKDEEVKKSHLSTWEVMTVVGPFSVSALLLGYIAGRVSCSYQWRKHMRVAAGLKERRVYVAVIPEEHFSAETLAHSLERAVMDSAPGGGGAAAAGGTSWLSRFWGRRPSAPEEPEIPKQLPASSSSSTSISSNRSSDC